jgi:hypothetical protein
MHQAQDVGMTEGGSCTSNGACQPNLPQSTPTATSTPTLTASSPAAYVQSYSSNDSGYNDCGDGNYETSRTFTVTFTAPATRSGQCNMSFDNGSGQTVNFSAGDTYVEYTISCGCAWDPCFGINGATIV